MTKTSPLLMSCLLMIGCAVSTVTVASDLSKGNDHFQAIKNHQLVDKPFKEDPFFQTNADMFKEMEKMQQAMQHLVDKQFSLMRHNLANNNQGLVDSNTNAVQILEKNNKLIYKIKLPDGADKKIDISVKSGQLVISANISQKIKKESQGTTTMRYFRSRNSQSFKIPEGFDEKSMHSKLEGDSLLITLNKLA